MKQILSIIAAVIVSIGFLHSQNYPPVAYWQFEQPNDSVDATGNGFDLNFNTNNLVTVPNGQIGSYYDVSNTSLQPMVTIPMDDTIVFDDYSLEFWFRPDKDFYQGRIMHWVGKTDLYLSERSLIFRVRIHPGTWIQHSITLLCRKSSLSEIEMKNPLNHSSINGLKAADPW